MKLYVTIDTNVLVSAALKHNSVPGTILKKVLDGTVTPILHSDIVQEYRDVLKRPKFKFNPDDVDDIIEAICSMAIFVDASDINEELPDAKDVIFYQVAISAIDRQLEPSYLVTGNLKHFPMKTFIISPRDFLDLVENVSDY